jgi:excisionase family DNA binding protein
MYVMREMPTSSDTATRRLLTTGGAAEIAACDPATVRRAIDRGELRALRLGRSGGYRIPREALEARLRPAQTATREDET